jgi:hypothetical protein
LAKSSEPLAIKWSRELPKGCEPTTITVRLEPSGRWFVSLRIDDPTDETMQPVDSAVGLDVGVSSLVTLSTGEKIANPKSFDKYYQKLKRAQKSLSRKYKGSRNRDKARLKVARIQASISNSRLDHLHKLTTRLIRENQVLCRLQRLQRLHNKDSTLLSFSTTLFIPYTPLPSIYSTTAKWQRAYLLLTLPTAFAVYFTLNTTICSKKSLESFPTVP